jgi:hypothetical protein
MQLYTKVFLSMSIAQAVISSQIKHPEQLLVKLEINGSCYNGSDLNQGLRLLIEYIFVK